MRTYNKLDVELTTHLHGGHGPAHADDYPNVCVLPGRARDYYYPNTLPLLNGEPDFTESPSTMWLHDHAMDVAGPKVWSGLAGFYLLTHELECDLVRRNVLPRASYDIPLALQDRKFNSDGTLFYKLLDHNGPLGDGWLANGRVQPFLKVELQKYRLQPLNGCNARFLELRLSGVQPFTKLGKDSCLYNNAVKEDCEVLCPGERADVAIKFSHCVQEIHPCSSLTYSYDCRPSGNPRCGDSYDGDHDGRDYDRDDKQGYGFGYGMGSRDSYGYVDKSKGYRPDDQKCDDDRYGCGCIPWLKFVVEGSK